MESKEFKKEYLQRINKVLDYIEANLDKSLKLNELAEVACFSPFHFHRIFSSFLNETLNTFIQRIRLEKAANSLLRNKERAVTDIALDVGFSSSATFARSFKKQFGISASQWREGGGENSKICKMNGKASKATTSSSSYLDNSTGKMNWRIEVKKEGKTKMKAEVEIRDFEDMHVAYVRHVGPYQQNCQVFESLFGKLCAWAGPRGLITPPQTQFLTIYHDCPEITEDEKLRISVCLTVPKETEAEGEIGRLIIGGGKYAVARFELSPDEYGEAWQAIYGGWLPESGYQPDDKPPIELYLNSPDEHPEKKHIVEICVPVKPL